MCCLRRHVVVVVGLTRACFQLSGSPSSSSSFSCVMQHADPAASETLDIASAVADNRLPVTAPRHTSRSAQTKLASRAEVFVLNVAVAALVGAGRAPDGSQYSSTSFASYSPASTCDNPMCVTKRHTLRAGSPALRWRKAVCPELPGERRIHFSYSHNVIRILMTCFAAKAHALIRFGAADFFACADSTTIMSARRQPAWGYGAGTTTSLRSRTSIDVMIVDVGTSQPSL